MALKKHGYYDVQELIPLIKANGYKGDTIRILEPGSNGALCSILLKEVEECPQYYDEDMIELVKALRKIGIKSKEIDISVWW